LDALSTQDRPSCLRLPIFRAEKTSTNIRGTFQFQFRSFSRYHDIAVRVWTSTEARRRERTIHGTIRALRSVPTRRYYTFAKRSSAVLASRRILWSCPTILTM